jgi:hypothetical protein
MLLDNTARTDLINLATLLAVMRTEVPKAVALSVARELAMKLPDTKPGTDIVQGDLVLPFLASVIEEVRDRAVATKAGS